MKRLVLLCLACLAAVAATAFADNRAYTDPVGDAPSADADMVRLTHGHDGRVLVHKVTVRGTYDEDLGSPEIRIRVGSGRRPDFLLAGNHVLRYGSFETVGAAGFQFVSPDTVRWRFRPGAINNPDSYEWRAVYGVGDRDAAPDRYITHMVP